jgi:hypothetical protein
MRQKEPIAREAMDYSLAVHKMVDKVRGEETGDPVASQLVISSMMIGPKYAGIVRGLDRGHVLQRLELCCGNADESLYWLDQFKTRWPEHAREVEWLREKGLAISKYMHRRKGIFLLGLNEIDGEMMPWAPYADDEDIEDDDLELDLEEDEAEWPGE